jgi:hypothetical protein
MQGLMKKTSTPTSLARWIESAKAWAGDRQDRDAAFADPL